MAAHQSARIRRALTEIVAERGYGALTVRAITGRAKVSTKAFYNLFDGKEDCFLDTYDRIARRATRRMIAAQASEDDWRERARLVFDEFLRGLIADPDAARLALIEVHAAGAASAERAFRAEREFEQLLGECLARPLNDVQMPASLLEGIVAGIAGVARSRLIAGRLDDLRASMDELATWALSCFDKVAVQLVHLDRQAAWSNASFEPPGAASPNGSSGGWPSGGDRALVLAAVAKLAVEREETPTVSSVCATAHVSRRKFATHFDGVEACYVAALEQKARGALAQAARAQALAPSWSRGVCRAVSALSRYVSHDQFLARACLADEFSSGPARTRAHQRLVATFTEQLCAGVPIQRARSPIALEASTAAIWSLFRRHARGDRTAHPFAATMAYLALTPITGPNAAVAAIRNEQIA